MLVRSAGSRQRRQTARLLASSFAQLNLPWLAPAQLRWSASQANSQVATISRVRKRSPSRRQSMRALATAATESYTPHYPAPAYGSGFQGKPEDGQSSWKFSSETGSASPASGERHSAMQPSNNPIMLNHAMTLPEPMIKLAAGTSATTIELLQYLRTSLQVGRYNRAEEIIRRLADSRPAQSPELSHAHSVYLESMLTVVASHGRGSEAQEKLDEMERWFEEEIKAKGVTVDAKMIVIMIRASIRALDGAKRDSKIQDYAALAQGLGDDIYDEVLFSEDYDDNEFTILGATTSTYFEPEQALESTADEPPQSTTEQYQRSDHLSLDGVADVRATELRGEGLQDIKRIMKSLTDTPSLAKDAPIYDQREVARDRQRQLEETSVDVAIDRWRRADRDLRKVGIHTALKTKSMGALLWQWYDALLPELEKELAACKKGMDGKEELSSARSSYAPFLELVPLRTVAASTILSVLTTFLSKSKSETKTDIEARLASLTVNIGSVLEDECRISHAKANGPLAKQLKSRTSQKRLRLLARQLKAREATETTADDLTRKIANATTGEWPVTMKVRLGAMLLGKLLETAQISVTRKHPRTGESITHMQPAILHRVKYEAGRKVGTIAPNPALLKKLESEPLGSMMAKRMPMIVEPKPWTSWDQGGYIHHVSCVMRIPEGDKSPRDYLLTAHDRGDMEQVYAGLNALGKVPWKIHKDVFQVQLDAWNSGEAIANFAPLNPTIVLPPEPEPSDDPSPRRKWLSEVRVLENKRTGLHSQRCFQNFQLEVARTMVNEIMYFPHNIDFRGRAYPIPPYLNHMGADNVRGLLVFAKGKPLGPEGLRWLKIHLATVAGHDKASLEERVEFTMKHLDDIYDSARKPLAGRRWWLHAEDAWQTLAACFELTAALDSTDPSKFVSHLPIQQDGTCNGLQHYAALGGDKVGAAQVNLEPGDRPADVYTAVLDAVTDSVHKDALDGNAIAQKLDGHITRKCVKQPVMTNVYGVTWYGAKEQVQRQLEPLFPDVRRFDDVNLPMMSQYVATKIFKSLGEMFAGAQAIQHWLGECANRISTSITSEQAASFISAESATSASSKSAGKASKVGKAPAADGRSALLSSSLNKRPTTKTAPLFKSSVVWTTPLRMPVVQPYRSTAPRVVLTNLQAIGIQEPKAWHPVNKRKQLQAFPPNFIHSLDATHMLLSALKCSEVGITFASIHDSFWCHAADVSEMSTLIRDAFISMHKEDIVGRLREEFQARYKGHLYMASVPHQSAAGRKIAKWRTENLAKGNRTAFAELKLEMERLELLQSDNAKKRAKGKAMVTPGSIVETEMRESGLSLPSDYPSTPLSSLPSDASAAADEGDAEGNEAEAEENYEADVAECDADADADTLLTDDVASSTRKQSPQHTTAAERDSRKRTRSAVRKMSVWLPLQFPEVPAKGDFDVTRLSASRYFFH